MFKRKFVIIFILNLVFIINSVSSVYSEEIITLDSLIKEAKERNPEIKSAYEKWLVEKSKITSSKAPPDPRVGASTGSPDMKSLSFSQAYPFPGKLSLRGKIAKETGDLYQQIYKAKELEIIFKLTESYYELFYIYKALQIYKENTELIKHFSKVAEQRYTVGKTKLIAVLRAQIELSKYLNMLITLEQDKETIQANINSLINRPHENRLGIPVEPEKYKPLKLTIKEVENLALKKRPELIARKEDIERSDKLLSLSKMSYLPDFMGTYKHKWQGDMDNYEVMLSLSVPLYFWKQNSWVKEKSHNLNRAKSDHETVKNITLYQVKALYVRVDTAQRLVELYRTTIIPQAEQALKVAEIAYQGEKINFLDFIDIQRSLLSFKLEYYKYVYKYEKYLAGLERIVGGIKLVD